MQQATKVSFITESDARARFRSTLKKSGFSSTNARKLVFEKLTEGPVAHSELASTLSRQIDRATTYRTLELFERLGIVNRIQQGMASRLELSEIFLPHHHHATCQQCGKVIDIVSPEIEAAISAVAHRYDFLAVDHSVELSGYCHECQSK